MLETTNLTESQIVYITNYQKIEGGASSVIISLVPFLAVILSMVVLFFFFLWYFRFKKHLLQSGNYSQSKLRLDILSLLSGLILFIIGIPLTLLITIIDGFSYKLLGGLIPLFVGGALLLFYVILIRINKK